MTQATFHFPSRNGLLAAALLALSALASAADPSPPVAAASSSAALMAPITTLIGDAECDNQSQCHVAGIGAKACGGPSSYLAWSGKTADVPALKAAIEAQSKAQADENRKRGLASDCMVTPEPTAICRPRATDGKKTCQLGQGGIRSAD